MLLMPDKLQSIAGKWLSCLSSYLRRAVAIAGTRGHQRVGVRVRLPLCGSVGGRGSARAASSAYLGGSLRFPLCCLVRQEPHAPVACIGRSRSLPILLFVLLLPFHGHAADIDAVAVQRSIDRGVSYLRKAQNERGGWDEYPGQSCGKTALCTLALLNAGVGRDDPDLVRAMKYLRSYQPQETYSVALQTMVFCQLGAAGDLPKIHRNVGWLTANQKSAAAGAGRAGSWDYGAGRGIGDPSNTQFALLALGAAHDRGIEVDSEVFELSLGYWNRLLRDGGWAYPGRKNSGSMTCAGIASVIIAGGRLGSGSSKIDGDQIQCCGSAPGEQDPITAGLQWLADNFSVQVNPGGGEYTLYYYLYALERVGRLSGRRFIGDHDWYREGAARLLELQDDFQGFWMGAGSLENQEIATSFALLFLSKGKRQVVIGRLKYPTAQSATAWQQHPGALRQLTRHVEYQWRRDLTWQTIDLTGASLQDLLQSPVLVISGSEPLRLSEQASDRLKEYLDQGGCILFEADAGNGCGAAGPFEASVKQLTESWFPGTNLARLPPEHPIWFAERNVDPTSIADDFWVYGIQACCRTAVFYVPLSLSCRWEQSDLLFRRDQGSKSIRSQIDGAVRIGQNLIAYATGRELKDKLESRLVIDGSDLPEPTREAIQLATLGIDAGGQEASRALPNAAALITAQTELSINAAVNPVGFDAEQLRDVSILWVHGRTDFTFSQSQTKVLREFIETGGVILGSAVCGAPEFSTAFRREMEKVLPESPLRPVPADHPLMTATDGFDLRQVTIRTPAGGGNQAGRRRGPAQLEMAQFDQLAAVFFSPLDLSCALESPNSVQCPGYSTEEAAKIVANLILFTLFQ